VSLCQYGRLIPWAAALLQVATSHYHVCIGQSACHGYGRLSPTVPAKAARWCQSVLSCFSGTTAQSGHYAARQPSALQPVACLERKHVSQQVSTRHATAAAAVSGPYGASDGLLSGSPMLASGNAVNYTVSCWVRPSHMPATICSLWLHSLQLVLITAGYMLSDSERGKRGAVWWTCSVVFWRPLRRHVVFGCTHCGMAAAGTRMRISWTQAHRN
jgi:hypothetical protein